MAYSAQADLNNVWGSDNVAAWSDLTGGGTADTSRISQAIAWADRRIDNRFRRQSRYVIPFTVGADGTYDDQLVDWSAVLAGDWLYRSRQVRRRRREGEDEAGLTSSHVARVMEEIDECLSNRSLIDASEKSNPMPDAPSCIY